MDKHCSSCDGEAVAISMERNGESYMMISCARCDTREWRVAGFRGRLSGVIDRLAGRSAHADTAA